MEDSLNFRAHVASGDMAIARCKMQQATSPSQLQWPVCSTHCSSDMRSDTLMLTLDIIRTWAVSHQAALARVGLELVEHGHKFFVTCAMPHDIFHGIMRTPDGSISHSFQNIRPLWPMKLAVSNAIAKILPHRMTLRHARAVESTR